MPSPPPPRHHPAEEDSLKEAPDAAAPLPEESSSASSPPSPTLEAARSDVQGVGTVVGAEADEVTGQLEDAAAGGESKKRPATEEQQERASKSNVKRTIEQGEQSLPVTHPAATASNVCTATVCHPR